MLLVHHRDYDFELPDLGGERGSLHEFDGARASRALALHRQRFGPVPVLSAEPASDEALARVHDRGYLRELADPARRPFLCAELMDQPAAAGANPDELERHYLAPMRLATGGTLQATRWLLGRSERTAARPPVAVNLSGGYHHAGPARGGGFCAWNDLALAAELAVREHGAARILCVDLDAHQGDGTARCFAALTERLGGSAEPSLRLELLDLFNEAIWPGDTESRARTTWPVPLPDGTDAEAYLARLDEGLDRALDDLTPPDLVLYNAGSDVLRGDPLGRMDLDLDAVTERDRRVLAAARAVGAPLLATASGGYTELSHRALASLVGSALDAVSRS